MSVACDKLTHKLLVCDMSSSSSPSSMVWGVTYSSIVTSFSFFRLSLSPPNTLTLLGMPSSDESKVKISLLQEKTETCQYNLKQSLTCECTQMYLSNLLNKSNLNTSLVLTNFNVLNSYIDRSESEASQHQQTISHSPLCWRARWLRSSPPQSTKPGATGLRGGERLETEEEGERKPVLTQISLLITEFCALGTGLSGPTRVERVSLMRSPVESWHTAVQFLVFCLWPLQLCASQHPSDTHDVLIYSLTWLQCLSSCAGVSSVCPECLHSPSKCLRFHQ